VLTIISLAYKTRTSAFTSSRSYSTHTETDREAHVSTDLLALAPEGWSRDEFRVGGTVVGNNRIVQHGGGARGRSTKEFGRYMLK
jgi:hypothetical protein